MFGLFRFPFLVSTDASRYRPSRTGQFIQDEAHTEAPMTQRERAAATGSVIDHVWFVRKLSEQTT